MEVTVAALAAQNRDFFLDVFGNIDLRRNAAHTHIRRIWRHQYATQTTPSTQIGNHVVLSSPADRGLHFSGRTHEIHFAKWTTR